MCLCCVCACEYTMSSWLAAVLLRPWVRGTWIQRNEGIFYLYVIISHESMQLKGQGLCVLLKGFLEINKLPWTLELPYIVASALGRATWKHVRRLVIHLSAHFWWRRKEVKEVKDTMVPFTFCSVRTWNITPAKLSCMLLWMGQPLKVTKTFPITPLILS